MIDFIYDILFFLLKTVGLLISPFVISMALWFFYFKFFKHMELPACHLVKLKRRPVLVRLLFDFPKRFVLDRFTLNPDVFREKGVHVICGEQGSGKSITLTYMLLRFIKQYPNLVVKTNYGFNYQTAEIRHWKDIVDSSNGEDGEIDVIDEIQNWFNSLQSKDFPPEMMTEITQQRKQRKCIFGTAQVFGRISKPIREQITYLYEPVTLFGCLTIVRKYKPVVNNQEGVVDAKKLKSIFFFVHSDEIRGSFDTYRKIKEMSKSGFKSDVERSCIAYVEE